MKAINLSELFGQKIFRIPDYQRGYSWEHKQLSELWDDIQEIPFKETEFRPHYTGTIYVEASEPLDSERWLSGTTFFSVVDGQQRLTTISILLYELLKRSGAGYCNEESNDLKKAYLYKPNLTGESKIYRFSYSPSDRNQSYLLNKIFEDENIIFDQSHYNLYSKNLAYAKNFFAEKIGHIEHSEREILFRKITTALRFDFREIEKDLDVQAVFETMNNRGKSLSTLEKLKNRLMHLCEKLPSPTEDRKNLRERINQSWGVIYGWLARNPENILDEDEFLSAHLSLLRTPKEAVFSEKLAEGKLFEMFCNRPEQYENEIGSKEEKVTFEKIQSYIQSLSSFAPKWYEVHNSKIKQLNKILLLNRGKEIRIFLTQLISHSLTVVQLIELLNKLEAIFFRNRIQGIGVIDERTFASWARELFRAEYTISEILERMDNLLRISVPTANMVQFFSGLYNYERGTKGFHRWGNLKYFLFEYEDYLKKIFAETNDKVTLEDFESTTIEHIIPQHFIENWHEKVNEVSISLKTEHIHHGVKVMLNTLGNLTILKNGKNSSLGNRSWEQKRHRFQTGSYNEIQIARYEVWNRTSICNRGEEMLRFLVSKIPGLALQSFDIDTILYSDQKTKAAIKDGLKLVEEVILE